MARLLTRLALVFITLLATGCAGGAVLGAASAETHVRDLWSPAYPAGSSGCLRQQRP